VGLRGKREETSGKKESRGRDGLDSSDRGHNKTMKRRPGHPKKGRGGKKGVHEKRHDSKEEKFQGVGSRRNRTRGGKAGGLLGSQREKVELPERERKERRKAPRKKRNLSRDHKR